MLRSFLLAPCLLICLACATPFPIESLEEGMTMERATEAFGEPSSTNAEELSTETLRSLERFVAELDEASGVHIVTPFEFSEVQDWPETGSPIQKETTNEQ